MSAYFVQHFLKGRRFLITGATGGAGSRTAIEISRVGGICTLVARDGNKAERVLRDLHGAGHSTLFTTDSAVDVTSNAPYDGWFDAAGMEAVKPLSGSSDTGEVFHANVNNIFNLMASVGSRAKPLIKDGGSIVLMSSVAAVRGQTGMSMYCASKAAVEGLVRASAVELAPRRIRVNCIRAGAFASPMHTRICQRATVEAIDEYAKKHLFGFGRTEDIAQAALFLLGDTSRWITGTSLVCDGGYACK